MAGDPVLASFLGRWLMARTLDRPVKKAAETLYAALPKLTPGETADAFRDRLGARVDGLRTFLEHVTQDDRKAPPNSARGHWLRDARLLLGRWNASRWDAVALELSAEKNAIALAIVTQSLEEAISQRSGDRLALEPTRTLRAAAERAFVGLAIPPAPQAPWTPSDYLFPADARAVVAAWDRTRGGPEAPVPDDARPLAEAVRTLESGWPVRRGLLEAAVRPLDGPESAELRAALSSALRDARRAAPVARDAGVERDVPTASPAPAPVPAPKPTDPRTEAVRRLGAYSRTLSASSLDEARAFGARLAGLPSLPGADTTEGLHRELAGCLAYLDGLSDAGTSGRWRSQWIERLARVAGSLGGGEVVGDHLVGQPLGRWTEVVSVDDYDGRPPSGEPRTITAVHQVGYVLIFSDGARKTLVRARVRVAL